MDANVRHLLLFAFVRGLCIIQHAEGLASRGRIKHFQESICRPTISEGSFNELDVDGHTSFECDISSCSNVSRIVFEKTDLHLADNWMQVFEGVDKINHHAINTVGGYSVANRTTYAPFPTQHILYLDHLKWKDHGKWRCVVYNKNYKRIVSQPMILYVEPVCNPSISIGGHSELHAGGHAFLECDISSCSEVSKSIFEKTETLTSSQWTSVFQGTNKTNFNAIDTGGEYSLAHRADYGSLPVLHTLSIHKLHLQDQGKWRCVVFDQDNIRTESQPIAMDVGNFIKEVKIVTPGITRKISNHKFEFTCDVTTKDPNLLFIWTANSTVYGYGKYEKFKHKDGLWLVRTSIQLHFEEYGEVTVGCRINNVENPDVWKWNTITVDVKKMYTTAGTVKYGSTTVKDSHSVVNHHNYTSGLNTVIIIVGLLILVAVLVTLLVITHLTKSTPNTTTPTGTDTEGHD